MSNNNNKPNRMTFTIIKHHRSSHVNCHETAIWSDKLTLGKGIVLTVFVNVRLIWFELNYVGYWVLVIDLLWCMIGGNCTDCKKWTECTVSCASCAFDLSQNDRLVVTL